MRDAHGGRPVVDFDLDAATSRAASDAAWDAVRAAGCPVAWTEHNGGYWVITGYDEVAAAFRDWERFSSARLYDPDQCAISVSNGTVPLLLPEESDPPEWKDHRRTIAALLSPAAAEHLRGRARHFADHYLDRVIERGACDLVDDFTVPVPASVVLEWMGFPSDEWEWFWTAFHGVSAHPNGTPEHRAATAAYADVMSRITEELRDRVRDPRDDALTTIALHEIDGVRITEDVARSIAFLTVTGGIDTTTSFTGAALLHLSQHPADRARLLDDAGIIRNRLKVDAAIANASVIAHLRETHGGFSGWLDAHQGLTKDEWVKLFKRTFRFTGGEITGEFLMSTGRIDGAHHPACPVYAEIAALSPPWLTR